MYCDSYGPLLCNASFTRGPLLTDQFYCLFNWCEITVCRLKNLIFNVLPGIYRNFTYPFLGVQAPGNDKICNPSELRLLCDNVCTAKITLEIESLRHHKAIMCYHVIYMNILSKFFHNIFYKMDSDSIYILLYKIRYGTLPYFFSRKAKWKYT